MQSGVGQSYPSPELLECPFPFFARAREQEPVRRDPVTGMYLVFRHEDIAFALRHDDVFQGVNGAISYDGGAMVSATNPPEHKAIRDLAFRAFTPARLRSYEPMVSRYADALIDEFAPTGSVELVGQFAIPLPGLVICRLMGLPTEGSEFETILDRMSMRSSDARHRQLVSAPVREGDAARGPHDGAGNHAPHRIIGSGIEGMHEYVREQILGRVQTPGDDVLSELVGRHIEQTGALDLPRMVTVCTELLAGGLLTTAQMIANGMMLLAQNPAQMQRVLADPKRLVPWLLEETLRLESPVQSRERITSRNVELSGVQIPAGSPVLLVHASGNRDPACFSDPERFDVERSRRQLKQHFGFGLGRHFCLGAPLARMEGEIAFKRLLHRLPALALAEGLNDLRHIDFAHFRAVRELHLNFEASPAKERAWPA
jgi:cytochrome P450